MAPPLPSRAARPPVHPRWVLLAAILLPGFGHTLMGIAPRGLVMRFAGARGLREESLQTVVESDDKLYAICAFDCCLMIVSHRGHEPFWL